MGSCCCRATGIWRRWRRARAPVELHVLRSDRMRVVPGADGWPVAYEYAVGGESTGFTWATGVSPICHVKSFHPQDDHYGLSPMQAAATAVDVHNAASRWSKALAGQCGAAFGAIVYRAARAGDVSADQYERLQSEMESHHQGARNAGRRCCWKAGLTGNRWGFSPRTWNSRRPRRRGARDRAGLRGAADAVGDPGDATYANYQEANRAFYRLTVLPLARGSRRGGALAGGVYRRGGRADAGSGSGAGAGGGTRSAVEAGQRGRVS